jgi:hypothetical protein
MAVDCMGQMPMNLGEGAVDTMLNQHDISVKAAEAHYRERLREAEARQRFLPTASAKLGRARPGLQERLLLSAGQFLIDLGLKLRTRRNCARYQVIRWEMEGETVPPHGGLII